jgi:HEAT repeat protein
LWANARGDGEIRATLKQGEPWRQMAAAREAGERSLQGVREDLEKLARSSRRDLAAVALAALGCLRARESLPLLVERAADPNAEIADAALVALDDLDTPEAEAALAAIADDEERSAVVRNRAKALVEARSLFPRLGREATASER